MPVRLGRFEMPKRLTKEDSTATETYAKFVAEPFETGYGHTIGNSLRRVLLSSLEGAAITSIKIEGAMHEFATIDGVVEDVTDIVLNLKKILFKAHSRDPQTLLLSANKEGAVTAADIAAQPERRAGQPRPAHLHARQEEEVRDGAWRSKSAAASCPATRTRSPTSPSASLPSTRSSRPSPASATPSKTPASASAPTTTG